MTKLEFDITEFYMTKVESDITETYITESDISRKVI